MRIITYNLRQRGKREQWLGLASESPDILLLQESSDPATYAAGEQGRWLWQQVSTARFGSALWVSSGMLEPVQAPGFEGWITLARVTGHAAHPGPFMAASLHAPGHLGSYISTVARMVDVLAQPCSGCPVVIGGDFNMATGRRDQGEELVTTPAERRVLERIETELGLVGCWQAANPGRQLPQTLRWVANPATAYHCDGLFVSRGWAARLQACRVLPTSHPSVTSPAGKVMSDHNPVLADFLMELQVKMDEGTSGPSG